MAIQLRLTASKRWWLVAAVFFVAFCCASVLVKAEFEGLVDDAEDEVVATKQPSPVEPEPKAEWDEDEFELPAVEKQAPEIKSDHEVKLQPMKGRSPIKKKDTYYVEMVAVAFLLLYGANLLYGRAYNNTIAHRWVKHFACEGGIFDKNFSLIGTGDSDSELIMRESASIFKFYASGRRYCQGLLATLNLRARQDILSLIYYLVDPREDTIDVEVYMNESSMPTTVLAVAVPKAARALLKNFKDVVTFTKQITVAKDRLPTWPAEKLTVLAEHSSVFYDLFSDSKLQQLFASEGPYKQSFKYFRSMHFTTENSEGSYKRVLKFTFALPDPENMQHLTNLIALIPLFIDLLGTYKLSLEAQKKASEMRAKLQEAAYKEGLQSRKEALLQKKAEKLKEEKERMAKLPPETRRKLEEKQAKAQQRKQIKVKRV